MAESIHIDYQKLTESELLPEDQNLVKAAIAAMDGAHAPYSNFKVGSAVRLEDGKIVTGNNQENAAYPSGLCAERVALFAAKSQSTQGIKSIAVVAQNQKDKPADAFSCGNCRQVMLEYASMQQEPIRIVMRAGQGNFVVVDDVKKLLPFIFDAKTLGQYPG